MDSFQICSNYFHCKTSVCKQLKHWLKYIWRNIESVLYKYCLFVTLDNTCFLERPLNSSTWTRLGKRDQQQWKSSIKANFIVKTNAKLGNSNLHRFNRNTMEMCYLTCSLFICLQKSASKIFIYSHTVSN